MLVGPDVISDVLVVVIELAIDASSVDPPLLYNQS